METMGSLVAMRVLATIRHLAAAEEPADLHDGIPNERDDGDNGKDLVPAEMKWHINSTLSQTNCYSVTLRRPPLRDR